MKRIVLICSVLLATLATKAQQDPMLSNYRFNLYVINPAVAGSQGQWAARASYRGDWVRFPGAPITATATLHGLIFSKVGFGLGLFSDVIGPERKFGGTMAYSYHIPVGNSNLSLGFNGRLMRFKLNSDQISTQMPNDPAIFVDEFKSIADLSLGAFWYTQRFYGGLSVQQLAQLTDAAAEGSRELSKHLYVVLGNNFKVSENFSVEPSAIIRKSLTENSALNYDIGAKLHFLQEQLTFGASYRKESFISLMTGFNIENTYMFTYSYDLSTADFQQYSLGSHEVAIGYNFGKQKFDFMPQN